MKIVHVVDYFPPFLILILYLNKIAPFCLLSHLHLNPEASVNKLKVTYPILRRTTLKIVSRAAGLINKTTPNDRINERYKVKRKYLEIEVILSLCS